MTSIKYIKVAFLGGWALFFLVWLLSGTLPKAIGISDSLWSNGKTTDYKKEDYVGSETCRACHEAAFNSFSDTKHAKLSHVAGWKDRAQGCESCHGPGKAHVDAAGDVTKIISFKNKTSKEISETCLTCHAGKEDHNKFRRGEHWRNNIGCTDCHVAHGPPNDPTKPGSQTFISKDSEDKPGTSTLAMLKLSEPQLCIQCHNEMKSQFHLPFHHKVLEGQMKCSDCHNPHAEFELKQTRLAVGADAPCIKCHTDKQGPFVYEHLPTTVEGCAACHTPHGSSNPKMLKRNQVRQLCLECHSTIFDDLAPNAPSFHNQATVRFQNCTICHVKIHGSQTHAFFFR